MDNSVKSVYTKPREWDEWLIGTFDPTFKQAPRFFAGWDKHDPGIMALLIKQEHGYDKAVRMPADEAENEMLLLQACVGPDVHVYRLPYYPRDVSSLIDASFGGRTELQIAEDEATRRGYQVLDFIARTFQDPTLAVILVAAFFMIVETVKL